MSLSGFLFFTVATLLYVWNGNDSFSKKRCILFAVNIFGILMGTAFFGRLMYNLIKAWPFMLMDNAEKLTVSLGASFISLIGMKFLVVMTCAIFSGFMGFHKSYNTENYSELSLLAKKVSPSLLIFVKVLVSGCSVLIFYGIWFGR